jgi:hypothetical protein
VKAGRPLYPPRADTVGLTRHVRFVPTAVMQTVPILACRSCRAACAAHPVREGRAVDLHAVPGEDLALPVKRKVIAVLGDQDMSEKTRTGEALGDRALRGGRLMNSPAGPAAVARPADADDSKPRGHMIEPFGNWRAKFKAEPQPPSPKLLYRRRNLILSRASPP